MANTTATKYVSFMLEMCKNNLALNLPFVHFLVLWWFELMENAREAELKPVKNLKSGKHRTGYGFFLCQFPADMLVVISMHKLWKC